MSTNQASTSAPLAPSLFSRLLSFFRRLARLLGLTGDRPDPKPDTVDDGIGSDSGSDSQPWSMPPPPPPR